MKAVQGLLAIAFVIANLGLVHAERVRYVDGFFSAFALGQGSTWLLAALLVYAALFAAVPSLARGNGLPHPGGARGYLVLLMLATAFWMIAAEAIGVLRR